MVKTNNTKFSTASVAKGSLVLSRTVEKNFALEAENSRLQHHVSVLTKRLHTTTCAKEILESILHQFREKEKRKSSGDEVAEEVEKTDPTDKVAENWEEVRPAYEEVAEDMSVAKEDDEADGDEPHVAVPGMEVACGYNRYVQDLEPYDQKESIQVPMQVNDESEGERISSKKIEEMEKRGRELIKIRPSSLSEWEKAEEMVPLFKEEVREIRERSWKEIENRKRDLETSGEEDVVIGGVIVAGGASAKTKKKKNKKKQTSKAAGNGKKEIDEGEKVEGLDKDVVKRNWTVGEWRKYGESVGYEVEVESDYGPL